MKVYIINFLKFALVAGITFLGVMVVRAQNFKNKFGMSKSQLAQTVGKKFFDQWLKTMMEYLGATEPYISLTDYTAEQPTGSYDPYNYANSDISRTTTQSYETANPYAQGDVNVSASREWTNQIMINAGLAGSGSSTPWLVSGYPEAARNNLIYLIKKNSIQQTLNGLNPVILSNIAGEYGIDYEENKQVINNAVIDYVKTL